MLTGQVEGFVRRGEQLAEGGVVLAGHGDPEADGHGQGDLSVDPQFIGAWPKVDLHLKSGSPAVGHGAY